MSTFHDRVFVLVQTVLRYIQQWLWWGIGKQDGYSYEESAHVYKILYRHRSQANIEFSSKDDFIYIHERFCHPSIALKDMVSLYSVTLKEAVFVDCGNVDVFDSTIDPFVYNVQFSSAIKIIILPIDSFHRISKEIPLPKIPIIHLANHSRCGSTLVTKLFEGISNTLSISETNSFTDLASLSRKGHVSYDALRKLCYSTIMCTVKHANERKSELVFIKCQNIAVYISDVLVDAVPSIKQIYMYRQPVPFVRSHEKLAAVNFLEKWTPKDTRFWSGLGYNKILTGLPKYSRCFLEGLSSFTTYGLLWITGAAAFSNLVKNGYEIKSLKYEDFVADPRKMLLAVFDYADIPVNKLPDIDKVMSKDSQAGSAFSTRSADKKILEAACAPITEELKAEVDAVCHDFKVPLFWNTFHLPEKL